MEHHIVKGNPVQINWTFKSIAGGEFSLAGYHCRLYYSHGAQSVLATGVTHSGNVLTWSFVPDAQWKNGYYDIMVEVYASTTKILTITYPEVFNLVSAATTNETSTAVQNDVATIDIESSCDFNRFAPVIPTVGDDNKWYVNGAPVLDPSGNPVYATGPQGVGISDFAKTGTSGLVDTYTITFTNGTTKTIDVTNGKDGVGIRDISKTGTEGNVDTYTILFTDGTSTTFTVTNAKQMTLDDVPTQDSSNPVKSSGLYAMYEYITKYRFIDNSLLHIIGLEFDAKRRINIFRLDGNLNQTLVIPRLSGFVEWWLFLTAMDDNCKLIIKPYYRFSSGDSRSVTINGTYIVSDYVLELHNIYDSRFVHIIADNINLNFEFAEHP